MARNVKGPPAGAQEQMPVATPEPDAAPPGGSPGMPVDPNTPSTRVGGPEVHPGPLQADPPGAKVARTFKVVGGPARVMYGGTLMLLRIGATYSEASCDLDQLVRQGVRLEPVGG